MAERKKLVRITTVPESLYYLMKNQLRYMNEYFEVIAISSGGEYLEIVKEEQGIRTLVVTMTRKISPVKDIISIYNLYKILIYEKPLIVHSHTPKAGFVAMIASFLARIPIRIHTVAGLPLMETSGIKRIVLELIEKITYALAIMVYPNSFGLKDFILKNKYCKPEKIKVIGKGSSNGIDTTYFNYTKEIKESSNKLKRELNISKENIVFCFIGRIVGHKGINELLQAFNEINETSKNTKLVLVGQFEPELDPISALSYKIMKKNKNIIYCGFQKDVRLYLAISDVLVFPSYREGFPNVPMQAGAMGLPCIVTNINGCNEIIENDLNGLVVEPKNTGQLKYAMSRLAKDVTLRSKLARNARKVIVERFEKSFVWEKLLEEYKYLNGITHGNI